MKPIVRAPLIGTLVALVILAHGAQAAGPTDVKRCGTISSPGSYVLAGNIASSNLAVTGNCIYINADNVTLDFAGFAMSGDGTGTGVFIEATGVTLRNGTITGFSAGITIGVVQVWTLGNIVESMRVRNNTLSGVMGGSAVVRNSLFTGNGTAIGVNDGSLVTGNRVYGNNAGIYVQAGSIVQGNVVQSNSSIGIGATCPSLVLGNTSTNNGPINVLLSGAGCTSDQNVAP